nr:MAG TPA: hypothetical protein [Caudoviricetes sp.]
MKIVRFVLESCTFRFRDYKCFDILHDHRLLSRRIQ